MNLRDDRVGGVELADVEERVVVLTADLHGDTTTPAAVPDTVQPRAAQSRPGPPAWPRFAST